MTVADILPKGEKPSMPMENGEIMYRGVAMIQDKGSKWRIKVSDAITKALGKKKLDDNRPWGSKRTREDAFKAALEKVDEVLQGR